MRKVISFCVWGDKPIYNYGLYEFALKMPFIFPEWKMVIYYTKTALQNVINELKKINYVEIILVDVPDHNRNSMLRFLAGFDKKNDIVIFRDTDSLPLQRDAIAVEDWLNSGKDVHIIRDNKKHGDPILAGLWGVRNHFLIKNKVKNDYDEYFGILDNRKWGTDQIFLSKYIYPLLNESNSKIHDEYGKKEGWATKFPKNAPKGDEQFCGSVNFNIENAAKKFNYYKSIVTKTRTENKI